MTRKRSATKEPFLPFFVGDFAAATAEWEGEAISLYATLLIHQWAIGSIPSEPKSICKLVKWDWELFAVHWKTVRKKFVPTTRQVDGDEPEQRLINARLEQHRDKTRQLSAKNSESGSKGAAGKWGDDRPDHGATRAQRLAEARKRGTHTAEEWTGLLAICGPNCRRCGASGVVFVKDHIHPIYQGGSDAIENLQPLCKPCNSAKGPDRTDYRPRDWRERLAIALETSGESGDTSGGRQASRLAGTPGNPSHPIPSHPDPSDPIRETSAVTLTDAGDEARVESASSDSNRPGKMTPHGAMAIALRNARVRVTSDDAVLHEWIRDHYTIEQMLEAVDIAKLSKPNEIIPAKYLDRVVRNMGKRQPALVQPSPPQETAAQREWRVIAERGKRAGFREPRRGEKYPDYERALKQHERTGESGIARALGADVLPGVAK